MGYTKKRKYANPKSGIYVRQDGSIFVLLRPDGPYPLADGSGYVTRYTFWDDRGKFPKTVIEAPFTAKRIDGLGGFR